MPYTLIKTTNIGLKITDSLTVPVIKAVGEFSGTLNSNELNSLYSEIFMTSKGFVGVCSAWSGPNSNIFSQVINGDNYYGTASGFKLRVIKSNNRQISSVYLYFNDICVSGNVASFTGYASYEAVFIVVFVDSNNNIYPFSHNNSGGLYLLSGTNFGYNIIDNKVVTAPIIQEATVKTVPQSNSWTVGQILGNISNYITNEVDPTLTDPYNPGGDTGNDDTGRTGGTGDFDGTSDSIDFPGLPSLSAVDTGFITLFNPSASQLKSLANYMWSGLFDLDTFKKIFANPMDCILGLSIVPVNVPSGDSDTVKVGNISTGVTMTKAASQYVSVDCGTLNINEFWGAYLDYSPYTKAEIYLPYVGTHPLDIDDIMNKPVHVKYHIDILSGACIAFVKCGDSVLYSFIGQCSSSIPITGNDWTNVINGVINIAGAVGSMVMSGGMSAPMAIGQIASTAVNSSKPSVEKSGSLSGTGGMLGLQTPYMILTRPRQALPAQQNIYTGYPSFITRTLSSVSGYTEVDHVHLENIPGTESELAEIESLLKTGVIF